MMQKIVIQNFGPIASAEIAIKKAVVLIGEQASGKSTIAKLIYYFKSLREDLFNKTYNESLNDDFEFDYYVHLIKPLREKFYDFFGSTKHQKNFDITFYYSVEENIYLHLNLSEDKILHSTFSENIIFKDLSRQIRMFRKHLPSQVDDNNISEVLAYNQEKLKYAERLSNLLKETFCCDQDDNLFIVAGRNATVGYSDSFERQFFLNAKIQPNNAFQKRQQTIDETLMLDFICKVMKYKDIFKKFYDFTSYLSVFKNGRKEDLKIVINKIHEVLKGRYHVDSFGEKIVFGSNVDDFIYLSNASSGQQEVIRILQDIFLTIAENRKVLRIVEEPEAHLFPLAQKRVIELLVQMAKNTDSNQLIITTHSPYVLTVFNNLLFAQRVIDKNPEIEKEVAKIIGKEACLQSGDFSAYVLSQSDNKNEFSAKSIVDEATGMIGQNYLDTVSEILGYEFNSLYNLHSKSFERQ